MTFLTIAEFENDLQARGFSKERPGSAGWYEMLAVVGVYHSVPSVTVTGLVKIYADGKTLRAVVIRPNGWKEKLGAVQNIHSSKWWRKIDGNNAG